jgi:hypothetical protein
MFMGETVVCTVVTCHKSHSTFLQSDYCITGCMQEFKSSSHSEYLPIPVKTLACSYHPYLFLKVLNCKKMKLRFTMQDTLNRITKTILCRSDTSPLLLQYVAW